MSTVNDGRPDKSMSELKLEDLGWTAYIQQCGESADALLHKHTESFPARVVIAHGGTYVVLSEHGRERALLKGTLKRAVRMGSSGKPIVGDWVCAVSPSHSGAVVIEDILPRVTKFSRSQSGEHRSEQIVAANIDAVFILTSMNEEFNLRRLERYATQAKVCGVPAVLVLTKSDVVSARNEKKYRNEVEKAIEGVPVHTTSAVTGKGIRELLRYFDVYKTICLLGSSGVGKSSLVNQMLGDERQQVCDIRDDGKGRHTTSHREMLMLPGGGLIIDNPGMREIQLWDAQGEAIDDTFDDIIKLAKQCRFRDCRHLNEPDCAVKEAIASGKLQEERLIAWHRLYDRE